MSTTRFFVWILMVGLMVLGGERVSGQVFPNKPIRMVAAEAGGNADVNARLIAQGISGPLGQQMIIENRPAALTGEIVSKAPPDGYTLLHGSSTLWIGQLLRETPYDAVKDFSPITLVLRGPNVLVVYPTLPVNSVKELIALAKAKPGELNYASGPSGGSAQLAAELFKSMAGVNIVRIPYKGSGPALNALLGGQVQMTFDGPATVGPHIKSGKLRGLAVTSAEPTALLSGLPTVSASGLPGFESTAMAGIFAPAKTPEAIINRLNQEIVRFLNTAETKEKLFNAGVETVGSSPGELAAAIKSDIIRWGKVIKDAGIKAD